MAKVQPLADFIDSCLGKALAAQGFAASDILTAWPDIMGEKLGNVSSPVKLEWPRRQLQIEEANQTTRPEPARLIVAVEPAFALEIQQMTPIIIERINARYGWRCVGKLVLKQGYTARPPMRPHVDKPVSPIILNKIEQNVALLTDEPLKQALRRLGKAVLGSNQE